MATVNQTKQLVIDDPILVVHGGTPAAREVLMSHLRSTSLGFRLVELPADRSAMEVETKETDVYDFLIDFGTRISSLSEKERDVLQCILDGQTIKAISTQLDFSERTIELRKASLMKKLDASSHTELVCQITKFQTLQRYVLGQTILESTDLERETPGLSMTREKYLAASAARPIKV